MTGSCPCWPARIRARRRTAPSLHDLGKTHVGKKGSAKSSTSSVKSTTRVRGGSSGDVDEDGERTDGGGDEDLLEVPSTYANSINTTLPSSSLQLAHIYGYSSEAQRSNIHHLYPPSHPRGLVTVHPAGNHLVITAAAGSPSRTAPIPETPDVSQPPIAADASPHPSYFRHHVKAITAICIHPDGGIGASAELGPAPVVKVWAVETPGHHGPSSGRKMTRMSISVGQRAVSPEPGTPLGTSFSGKDPRVGSDQPDSELQLTVLATAVLPEPIHSVSAMTFAKDGTTLVIAGNREDEAEVLVYEWRKLAPGTHSAAAAGSAAEHRAPAARAVIPAPVFSLTLNPWSRREFIVGGLRHLSFWTIDAPLLSQTLTLTSRPAGWARDGEQHHGAATAALTVLCAAFTLAKGQRVLAVGTANGDVVFWKGDRIESHSRAVHKGQTLTLTPLLHPTLTLLTGGSDHTLLLFNDVLTPISTLTLDSPVRAVDAGGLGGVWYGWGEAMKRRASRALGLTPLETGSKGLGRGGGEKKRTGAGVRVGCGDGSLWVVEIGEEGTLNKSLLSESHASQTNPGVWGLAPHPTNPRLLLTCGNDGFIRQWAVEERKQITSCNLKMPLRSCTYDPSARQIAVGSDQGTIFILTPTLTSTLFIITQRRDTIHAVSYSPDGRLFAAATQEAIIDVYSVAGADGSGYQRVMCCRGHSNFVSALDWSVDSKRLQSNSGNSEIMFWTMATHPPPPPTPFAEVDWASATCPLSWATKGVYVSGETALSSPAAPTNPTTPDDWKIQLRGVLDSAEARADLFASKGCVLGLRDVVCTARGTPPSPAPDPDKVVVMGTTRGDVLLLRYPACAEGAPAYTYTVHAGPVGRVAVSVDGRWVFSTGAGDGCVLQRVWGTNA
ncbi:WD40-repeat-containing domain protein [Fimicolochytrium jonesii]|uniref:WD40-repeat-containing domain protein n=1 Tax=Fimicolochytrium jonesii TaxID=1396493 RepID=UPI0022FE7778|nr:WD40-repeat-containing domain protein [Fimicolochytrium jonesii]KAI8816386.1 WD40-repeat-containing domain protein [Fimicolochytrium jonesii]